MDKDPLRVESIHVTKAIPLLTAIFEPFDFCRRWQRHRRFRSPESRYDSPPQRDDFEYDDLRRN